MMINSMVRKRLSLVCPLLMLIAGCAVNDKGFMKLQYFENETSYLRIQKSWGGYLSTRHTDRGLVLGHTNRIIVYPKLSKKINLPIGEFLQHVDKNEFVEISAKDIDIEDMQPFAWIEKNKGFIFHANPLKIGMTAGVESRSVLRLPSDFDGAFIVKHYEDGEVKAGIQGSSQLRWNFGKDQGGK